MGKINLQKAIEILESQGYSLEITKRDVFSNMVNSKSSEILKEHYDFNCKSKTITSLLDKYAILIERNVSRSFENDLSMLNKYSECIKNEVSFILNRIKKEMVFTPLDRTLKQKDIHKIIDVYGSEKVFYVLHYDVKSSKYLNEIVFSNYNEAIVEFFLTKQLNYYDRIELVFSPKNDKNENIVLTIKGAY